MTHGYTSLHCQIGDVIHALILFSEYIKTSTEAELSPQSLSTLWSREDNTNLSKSDITARNTAVAYETNSMSDTALLG